MRRLASARLGRLMVLTLGAAVLATPSLADWPANGVVVTGSWSKQSRALQMFTEPAGGVSLGWDWCGGAGWYPFGRLERLDADGIAPTGWNPPVTPSGGDETHERQAARASDGSLFTVYRQWDALAVRLQHHLADATLAPGFSLPGLVVGTGTSLARVNFPAVVTDDAGGCYVAWLQNALSVPVSRVWLTRRQANGALAPGWSAGGNLIAEFPYEEFSGPPALARDGASGVIVVWGDNATVRAKRFGPDGAASPGWPASGLSLTNVADADGYTAAPQLIESGAGHWIAAWKDDPTGEHRVVLQRFGSDGALDAAWPAAGTVLQQSTADVPKIAVVTDGGDGAITVWTSSAEDAHATRVLSSGSIAPGWATSGVPLISAGNQMISVPTSRFAIAPTPSGGLVFAWVNVVSADMTASPRVRWLLSDGSSDPAGPETGLVLPHERQPRAMLGASPDGAGGAIVGWELPDETGVATYLVLSHVVHTPVLAGPPPTALSRAIALAPNPASRVLDVSFTLENAEPANVQLFDLGGRRLREAQARGIGPQVIRFDALDRLPAGIYLVRVTQRTSERIARVALVH